MTRASAKLAISQAALSINLKELETLLATTLFVRSKSGAALTEAGVAFLRYAGSRTAQREGVNTLRSGEREPITEMLGVLSTVESLLVPEVVCRLRARHPALVVCVVTGPSAYLLSRLRLGELDLVVGRMTDSSQILGLAFEHLYSESMTLVVRNGHPLLADPPAHKNLDGYPLVLPLAGGGGQFANSPTAYLSSMASAHRASVWKPVVDLESASLCAVQPGDLGRAFRRGKAGPESRGVGGAGVGGARTGWFGGAVQ